MLECLNVIYGETLNYDFRNADQLFRNTTTSFSPF